MNEEIKVIVLGGVESDSIGYDTVYDYLVNKKGLLGKSFKGGYCYSPEFAEMIGKEIDRKEVTITEDFLRKYRACK